MKSRLAEHLETECSQRRVKCEFCNEEMPQSNLEEHHLAECPYAKTPCVHHGCSVLVTRGDLSRHLFEVCSFRQEHCQSRSLLATATKPKGRTPKQIEERRQHVNTNYLQMAAWMGQGMEPPLMPNPDIVSRNPQLSTNHDSVISDQLAQAQNDAEEVGSLTSNFAGVRGQRAFNRESSLLNRGLTRKLTNLERLEVLIEENKENLTQQAWPLEERVEDIESLKQQVRHLEESNRAHEQQLVENERFRDEGRIETELLAQDIDNLKRILANVQAVCRRLPVNREGCLPNRELTRRLANLEDRTADNQVLIQEDFENLTRQLRLLEETVGTQARQLVENERFRDDGRMEIELLAQSIASLKGILTNVQALCSRLSVNAEDGIPNAELPRRPSSYENRTADQEEIRRQVAALRRQLETSQETTRRLEETIRQQEVTSFDGLLLWKVSDYAQRLNDATTGIQTAFYSPCFYTSRYGYKMCARLYLNGDSMGHGTHISLFFIVMHDQYNGVLRWPFRQKVTMMLLDQDNVEHVIHAFTPDPNSSSFQRPRREMNVASGCPLFCPLSELNNHAYVRDDTMFLKIIVDT